MSRAAVKEAWSYFFGTGPVESPRWRRAHAAVLAVLSAVVLGLFWHFAMYTAVAKNKDPLNPKLNHDQTVYLDHAYGYKNTGASYWAPRQHMPGYGLLLTPFLEQDENIWHFFWRARWLVVSLSVLAVLLLAGTLRLVFPWTETVLLSGTAALVLYVFRGGFFQPELLFNSLFLLSLILLLRCLLRPSWWLGLTTGAVFACTHLLKSSMPAAIALLGAGVAVRIVLALVRKDWRGAGREALCGLLVPVTFLALLAPYLLESTKRFGSPFYSAHTKYHMWVDTHTESRALAALRVAKRKPDFENVRLNGTMKDLEGLEPTLRKWQQEGLPSAEKYFATHPWKQIRKTLRLAGDRADERLERDYPWLLMIFHVLVAAAGAALVVNPPATWRLLKTHWLPIGAYCGFIAGYLVAYLFYAKIGMGPRMFLTLAMPVLFGPAWLVWTLGKDVNETWFGRTLNFRKVANWILAITGVIAAHGALTRHIHTVIGGQ